METARWSIAERATRWIAVTTALIALSIAATAFYFVRAAAHRELDTVVRQQLDELELAFPSDPARTFAERRAEFEAAVEKARLQHRHNATAWRVWHATSGERLGDFGETALLAVAEPSPDRLDTTEIAAGRLWTHTVRLQDEYRVGMVVDATMQTKFVERFAWLSLLLALLSGLTTFFGGKYLVARAVAYMHEVAARARELRVAPEPKKLELPNAPEEIQELVDALATMLRNIHAEQERTRLLTAGLAHELGSPLQNLIGETEVALMRENSAAEYRQLLESHLDELRDLGHAIGNLMTLVSLTRGEAERVDLGEEARVRLRRERAHAERRRTELEVVTFGDLALEGDREALWLVVSNLVANAIDYTPSGGRVKLELRGTGERVRIVVDDTGPGVALELREKIFEAFFRGPTSKNRRAGYGLGLSIVKQAVESHGGTITVETSPLGGARFVVDLPRKARTTVAT